MFGADPTVVGRTLMFGTTSVEVVGVMPEGFNFPGDDVQMWSPWGWAEADRDEVWFRRAHFVRPIARLADGITPAAADAEFQLEVTRLQGAYPETNRVMGAGMMPLRSFLVRDARTPVLVLVGAVALLLLLACVNVANLALVRGSQRVREVALRHALGAGRARIAALLATESLLLAAAGGTLGLLLGLAGLRAVQSLTRVGIAGATNVALDYRVLLFTAVITALSGLLFALAPMLSATRANVSAQLKDGDRGGAGTRSGSRATGALVAAEVALAVLLAAGAGLMVRTSWHLRHIDPGFETDGALAVQFTVPSVRYPNRDGVLAFYDGLLESLEARPGIERAGSVAQLPLSAASWSSQFQAEGWPESRVGLNVVHRRADAGYFDALEIPLVGGRMFGPEDRAGSPLVVLINETFAREHFPGEDPIGQRIAYDRVANANSIWYEIVGNRQLVDLAMLQQDLAFRRNEHRRVVNPFAIALDQSGHNVDARPLRGLDEDVAVRPRQRLREFPRTGECPAQVEAFG
jgi:putative ABC transport system permease protein